MKNFDESNFVKSVKNDLNNSQSIDMVKNKAKSAAEKVKIVADDIQNGDAAKKKKIKIIAIAAVVVIVVLIIVTHIHTCEECEKVYFGNKHTISFWGESENVCKECYNDFYGN